MPMLIVAGVIAVRLVVIVIVRHFIIKCATTSPTITGFTHSIRPALAITFITAVTITVTASQTTKAITL
jgi:hypothetical protein